MITALHAPASVLKRASLYGSLTTRFVAFLVDTILVIFCYSIIYYSATQEPQHPHTLKELLATDNFNWSEITLIIKSMFFNVYFPVLHWFYYTFLESSLKQATIGKFTLGLRVTDLRGRRISFAEANFRYFSKIVSIVPFCLGFMLMHITRRSQMLHDYIAKTVVVTE